MLNNENLGELNLFEDINVQEAEKISGGNDIVPQQIHLQLCSGDLIVMLLEENPSTGFSWQIDNIDSNLIELQNSEHFTYSYDELRVGVAGRRIFTFKAKSEGLTKLQLKYSQSQDNESVVQKIDANVQIGLC